MTVTFTIPYLFLRAILAELRRQPYHVAVGDAGLNVLPTGDIEVLARAFRFVHEGVLRSRQEDHTPRFELGCAFYFEPPRCLASSGVCGADGRGPAYCTGRLTAQP